MTTPLIKKAFQAVGGPPTDLMSYVLPIESVEEISEIMSWEAANGGAGNLEACEGNLYQYQGRLYSGPELAAELAQTETLTEGFLPQLMPALAPASSLQKLSAPPMKVPLLTVKYPSVPPCR